MEEVGDTSSAHIRGAEESLKCEWQYTPPREEVSFLEAVDCAGGEFVEVDFLVCDTGEGWQQFAQRDVGPIQ